MAISIQRIKEMSTTEAKDALVSARQSIARMRGEAKKITERTMVGIAGGGGAAACGALKAFGLEEVADIPVAPAVGLTIEAMGIAGMGGSDVADYSMIAFGAALSAPYISEAVEKALR